MKCVSLRATILLALVLISCPLASATTHCSKSSSRGLANHQLFISLRCRYDSLINQAASYLDSKGVKTLDVELAAMEVKDLFGVYAAPLKVIVSSVTDVVIESLSTDLKSELDRIVFERNEQIRLDAEKAAKDKADELFRTRCKYAAAATTGIILVILVLLVIVLLWKRAQPVASLESRITAMDRLPLRELVPVALRADHFPDRALLLLQYNGVTIESAPDDGFCFYHCIASIVGKTTEEVYLRMTGRDVRDSVVWGGEEAIAQAAEIFKIAINLYQLNEATGLVDKPRQYGTGRLYGIYFYHAHFDRVHI